MVHVLHEEIWYDQISLWNCKVSIRVWNHRCVAHAKHAIACRFNEERVLIPGFGTISQDKFMPGLIIYKKPSVRVVYAFVSMYVLPPVKPCNGFPSVLQISPSHPMSHWKTACFLWRASGIVTSTLNQNVAQLGPYLPSRWSSGVNSCATASWVWTKLSLSRDELNNTRAFSFSHLERNSLQVVCVDSFFLVLQLLGEDSS